MSTTRADDGRILCARPGNSGEHCCIPDAHSLDVFQVALGGEAAVIGGLERYTTTDLLLSGDHVDRLKRLGSYSLDGALERRSGGNLITDTKTTKGTVRPGILQMKGEILVTETIHLLDVHSLEDLFGAHHSLTAGFWIVEATDKIGVHQFG